MSLDHFAATSNPIDSGDQERTVAWPEPIAGVGVWTTSLARSRDELDALLASLSDAERTRAARFGTPELRDRYVIGRGTLRRILGRELGERPERLQLARGIRGRPCVVAGGGLDFNVSHTTGMAVFAVVHGQRIGVDIEHRERKVNVEGIARKFMSEAERSSLQALDGESRRVALLRLWTCKEAMSKATGDALSAPFRHMTVHADTELRVAAGPPPYSPAQWRLAPVDGPAGYLATVALWTGR